MADRSEKVFGYVSKPLRERMNRIEHHDPDYTMSRMVRKGLEKFVAEMEVQFFGEPNREKSARRHPHAGA